MERVTRKQLETLVATINRLTGSPESYWTSEDPSSRSIAIGHYRLDKNLGGWCLERTCNASGGASNVGHEYRMTARECWFMLRGMVAVLERR